MLKLKQAVVVEGKYDAIKLRSILDAVIIVTNGFSIFKDREKRALLQTLAQKTGLVVLTDSDGAGFKIRNHLRSVIKHGQIINVYIPDVPGKERRKSQPSKEGKLGVEGMDAAVLQAAFEKAGVFAKPQQEAARKVTKLDFFELGLTGAADSAERRRRLFALMDLPARLSCNSALDVINVMMSYEEFMDLVQLLYHDAPQSNEMRETK